MFVSGRGYIVFTWTYNTATADCCYSERSTRIW